jgi:glyoxylase-like metal-dependent hydrolase (beta-lactamase superfamily II)
LAVIAVPTVQAKQFPIPSVCVHDERDGVVRFQEYIPIFGQFYEVNVYAIRTKEGVVLIDAGAEDMFDLLVAAIDKKFNKPVIAVLLTHGHADHAGAGSLFLGMGIPVYAPAGDLYIIQQGMNFPGVPREFTYTGYTPTVILNGGETIFGLKVVPTPGHTWGSVSYIDERKRSLFSGDTTIGYPGDDAGPEDLTFELENMTLQYTDTESLQMQLDSLNVLLELANSYRIDTIFPGHNRSYHGREEVGEYILHSMEIVEQALASR